MLTAEQRAMRRTGIGSSDVAPILGLGPRRENGRPYKGPLDVWVTKDTASRPGVDIDESDAADSDVPPPMVGHLLERTLLEIYTRKTNIAVERASTLRHASIPWALATPDALAKNYSIGCECKVVGARMLHEWRDGVPAGVEAQSRWAMGVTNKSRWDVIALLGGTEFEVFTLERNMAVERELFQQVEIFWQTYVIGDCEPPSEDPDEVERYLRRKYQTSTSAKCVRDDSEQTAAIVGKLADTKARIAALESEEKRLQNDLCRLIGDRYGIEGTWGRFLWVPMEGPVRWKDVALAVAGSEPSPEVIAPHRGRRYRVPQLHLAKTRPHNDTTRARRTATG